MPYKSYLVYFWFLIVSEIVLKNHLTKVTQQRNMTLKVFITARSVRHSIIERNDSKFEEMTEI